MAPNRKLREWQPGRRKGNDHSMDKRGAADFATSVLDAYHAFLGRSKAEVPLPEEARRVGAGLALISEALDAVAAGMKLCDLPASGLREAYGILNHLLTGLAHPVSRHIDGLRSGRFRPGRVQQNCIDHQGRMAVVGAVRGFANKAGIGQAEARRVVAERAAKVGVKLSVDQLKRWHDDFENRLEVAPTVWAAHLAKISDDADAALDNGIKIIWLWLGTPAPGKRFLDHM